MVGVTMSLIGSSMANLRSKVETSNSKHEKKRVDNDQKCAGHTVSVKLALAVNGGSNYDSHRVINGEP